MQSRYYDPVMGRFINADGYVNANGDLIGFNMYAYCSNNPVMYVDPTGKFIFGPLLNFVCVFAAGMAVGISIAYDPDTNYEYNSQIDDIDTTDFVMQQSHLTEYQYGICNMDYNGCEVINAAWDYLYNFATNEYYNFKEALNL